MELPARFGKYELIRHLATGGMAEIFLARSFGVEGFEKHLVIKRILPSLARDPRFVSMFVKEAKITAGLAHPNIVQIYELDRVGADHYIAMEYIRGRDLVRLCRHLRARRERLPVALAVTITASALRGLAYAHSLTDTRGRRLNLVHRDVSPHNIMISFQGEVKLFDFGIARLFGPDAERTGRPGGGKFAYMSPEQASGQPLDGRSDIFSAGVVLYELLTGGRLFPQSDPNEKLARVRGAIVPDPRPENPQICDALWDILRKILARLPGDRYARADLAEEDLRAFLFDKNLRADAVTLGGFLRETLGESEDETPGRIDLAGLQADIRKLQQPDESTPVATSPGGTQLTAGTATAITSGENKSVVVLSAEIVGLTDLSVEAEPDVYLRRNNRFVRRLQRQIERLDGIVGSYTDDLLTAFFGVPRTSEHDVDRALAAALALRRLSRRPKDTEGIRFQLCAGIHCGEITLGSQVERRRFQYLARGSTLKVARRLSQSADLDEILVSEAAARRTRGGFRFEAGPEFRLKGRTAPHRAQRLLGRRRTESGARSGRWIPRGDELEAISTALMGLAEARGAVLAVIGGAGTGKSRLVRELITLGREHRLPVYSAHGLPYGEDVPFAPFRDIVAGVLGIAEGADAATVRERLSRLPQLHLTEPEQAALGALFAVATDGSETSPDIFASAAIALIRGLAVQQPVLFVIEDVENLQPVERTVLSGVVRATRHLPVLGILTSRSPLTSDLPVPDNAFALGRLDAHTQAELVADIIRCKEVSPELLTLVERTAEGNPLYIETLLSNLMRAERVEVRGGRGVLVEGASELPADLIGLIAARVDALPDRERKALQVAAAIGMRFPAALLLAAVDGDPVGLVDALAASGLLVREAGSDERLSFSTPLVWETVRRSPGAVRQRAHHARIATAMTTLYSDRLDAHRSALARHCAAAGRPADAAGHAERAGKLLRSQQLIDQAVEIWEQALRWVDEARDLQPEARESLAREAWLQYQIGEAVMLSGSGSKAEVHLQIALDLAGEVSEPEIEARAQLILGQIFQGQGQTRRARLFYESCRGAAALHPPEGGCTWSRPVAVDALGYLSRLAQEEGRNNEAEALCEEQLKLAEGDDALVGLALFHLASTHSFAGRMAEALDAQAQALERALGCGDRALASRVVNNTGVIHYQLGRYEEALATFRRALEISQVLGHRRAISINLHNVADTQLRLGQRARAWTTFTRSREIAEQMGWERGALMNEPFIAILELEQAHAEGDSSVTARQLERLEKVMERSVAVGEPEMMVASMWLYGRGLWLLGQPAEAIAMLDRAVERAEANGDQGLLSRVQASRDALVVHP